MSKANELLQELSAKIILSNQGKIRFTATEAYVLVEKIHNEIADIRPTETTMTQREITCNE
nr:MAG TPA: hypothetical protein [Caudoviricetes sp.]